MSATDPLAVPGRVPARWAAAQLTFNPAPPRSALDHHSRPPPRRSRLCLQIAAAVCRYR